jgi:acetylornithine deacetylase/succinyl-diaminopimelate desuccinylase-like protein
MARFAANPNDTQAAEILSQDPENVGKLRTTCVATMLKGGHADNALPQSASVIFNCRLFPGMHATEVQQKLAEVAGPGVEIRNPFKDVVESDASPLRPDVVAAVTKAVHTIRPGVPLVPEMAVYTTDGSYFRGAGIPTYGVSGLFMKQSDDFAHGLRTRRSQCLHDELAYWHTLLTVGRNVKR